LVFGILESLHPGGAGLSFFLSFFVCRFDQRSSAQISGEMPLPFVRMLSSWYSLAFSVFRFDWSIDHSNEPPSFGPSRASFFS
jgi:hypothetical protein